MIATKSLGRVLEPTLCNIIHVFVGKSDPIAIDKEISTLLALKQYPVSNLFSTPTPIQMVRWFTIRLYQLEPRRT